MKHIRILFGLIQMLGLFFATSDSFGAERLTTLIAFDGINGLIPNGNLIPGKDGGFYGTTVFGSGTNSWGEVFRVTSAGGFSVLASFRSTNGYFPGDSLVLDDNGDFYGTTLQGGAHDLGTVFKLERGGKLISLFSFGGTNGARPTVLVRGSNGSFYGITQEGGDAESDVQPFGFGTVYKMSAAGELTTIVRFYGTNGDYPTALIEGVDGNLYGTTQEGGSTYDLTNGPGNGIAFEITTNGDFKVLHEFGGIDGGGPGSLIQGSDGNLYGTTYGGGTNGTGTVYRMTTDGTVTSLHAFGSLGDNLEGNYPSGKLYQGADGWLYGGTQTGGTNVVPGSSGVGTLYKISADGTFITLGAFGTLKNYAFSSGVNPNGVVEDKDGNLIGTTMFGGTASAGLGKGSIFKLTKVRPLVVIAKPHQHAGSGSDIAVTGKTKAKLNTAITNVLYQWNGGAWTNAMTADGWKDWTANVTLAPGTNIFSACAIDALGDASRTNMVKLQLP